MKETKRPAAEGVLLIGLFLKQSGIDEDAGLSELESLVETAGGRIVEKIIQRKDRPDPAYLIGKGKAEEIGEIVKTRGIRCAVFDMDLTPTQQRNLEEILDCKIIDRTRLILDVFARRARTKEGILQVELAQNMYLLPRLTGRGTAFSQQLGGIGARGPGERALEYDRRRIRIKIQHLKKELRQVVQQRQIQRARRLEEELPRVAIAGYTNVGKSSLLNRFITEHRGQRPTNTEPILADDRYFATLDPTTRRVYLPSGIPVLMTDTVGFIKDLPPLLATAFRATLEEIKQADLLLLVSDSKEPEKEIASRNHAIEKILEEFDLSRCPRVRLFSKCDLADGEERERLSRSYPDHLWVSSRTGEGLEDLLKHLENKFLELWPKAAVTVEASKGHLLREIYSLSKVLEFKESKKGVYKLLLQAPRRHLMRIKGRLNHRDAI